MKTILSFIAVASLALAQPEQKTAEQVYKNIVALKGVPADQVIPAMQFIAAALGMECSGCHVQGKFEADDKPAKKAARQMIEMTLAINKGHFNGRTEVSCYTCHRGSERPVSVPPVADSDTPPARAEARMPGGASATPDEMVANYVAAVGGADAIKKITSRQMTGTITVMGQSFPIELWTKAPDKRISISDSPMGHSITAFDGTSGWLGSARGARDMSPADTEAAALDAEFYLPLRIKEIFPQLRRGRPEEIDGTPCNVLNASKGQGHAPVRFYFDQKSGLLVRMLRLGVTPVGNNPTQIDYADYRDADGVKIPFRWTLARPGNRFTIQIEQVKSNVPIEDSKFAKPEAK